VGEIFFNVACPLSLAKDSQVIGSCVLAQVLGNKMFPLVAPSLQEPYNTRVQQSLNGLSDAKLRPNRNELVLFSVLKALGLLGSALPFKPYSYPFFALVFFR
jgi:hypothetical protein